MKTLRIRGGVPLSGEVAVSGSKNAALPILAASLLVREPIELLNLPEIRDCTEMLSLLRLRGVRTERRARGHYRLTPPSSQCAAPASEGEGRMRGSLYLLGASLAACGEASVGLPGGCDFGARPFDLHVSVLRALGASVEERDGRLTAYAPSLRGTDYTFSSVSVGATVNAILAATAARGTTVLRRAAEEPHVRDLIAFLVSAGAHICIPEHGVIVIRGGRPLHGTVHRIIPDMIEAGTYLLMAAATRGEITLRGAPTEQLDALFSVLTRMGGRLSVLPRGDVRLAMSRRPAALSLSTAPYPAFPTDLHPQTAAVLALGEGESRITETVFSGRFRYTEGLRALGAAVSVDGATVVIQGRERLFGAPMTAPDLRGGAALLIGALAAEGESLLTNAELLERGYEDPVAKLTGLGALISDGGDALTASPLRGDRRALKEREPSDKREAAP